MSMWCRVISPSFLFLQFQLCDVRMVDLTRRCKLFSFCFLYLLFAIVNIPVIYVCYLVSVMRKQVNYHPLNSIYDRTEEGSVLCFIPNFKVTIFRSKVTKFGNWVTWPRPRPLRGRFIICTGGVSPPSLYRIWCGQVSSLKSIKGSQKFRNWSGDPGHAHLGVILSSYAGRVRPPSLPNLQQIGQFFQKL